MTDTEIVDYLEKMLSWEGTATASLKLSSKDSLPEDWSWRKKLYRCGNGPWRKNLREAVQAKKEQK